jgi:hypothetical protein
MATGCRPSRIDDVRASRVSPNSGLTACRPATRFASPSVRSRMSAPSGLTSTGSTSNRTIRPRSAGNSQIPERVEPFERVTHRLGKPID